jgi:hypothetical protein
MLFGLFGSIGLMAATAHGAPPKVDGLFPAGAQRGQTVAISASGTLTPWPMNAWIDDPQIQITASEQAGGLRFQIGADVAPGAKLVRVFNAEGSSALVPFVVGTLAERIEQEPNDEPAKAERIDTPVTINGRLAAIGDADVFAVSLRAGQTLVAAVEANWPLGAPMDGMLQLLSSDGFVLQQENDSPRLDPRLVFTAPSDGAYLVRLFAFPATPTGSIQLAGGDRFVYRLTLTTQGLLDYAFPLAVQRPDSIAPGSVPRPALELCGWNIPASARGGLQPIETPWLGDPNMLTVYHPQLAGRAQVAVVADPVVVEAESNTAPDPQPVTLPVVVCGRISEPGDTDSYSFRAAKRDRIAVSVASQQLGFPLDPVLKVTDPTRKVLATQDDLGGNRDAQLVFNVPADGEYRVVVADLYRHGGPQHVYRLNIAPARADFALALAAGEFSVASGKQVEIPITIDRRNDFADEIEVSCTGLPSGVECQAAVSAPKGETSKKAKLIITGGEEAFSGRIQIVGTSRGTAAETRIARFALTDGGLSTESIWLTVSAK